MGFFKYNFIGTLLASTSMVFGAVYTLWTYNRIFFGNIRVQSLLYYKDLNKKEIALFSSLIVILFIMGLAPHLFLNTMFIDSLNILEHAKGVRKIIM
jgi:NADH:ubiquinone oxidoreductase subunit 4 (subunit M)